MRYGVVSDNRDFPVIGHGFEAHSRAGEGIDQSTSDTSSVRPKKGKPPFDCVPALFQSEDCKIRRMSHIYVPALTRVSPSDLVQSRYSASQHRWIASQDSAFLLPTGLATPTGEAGITAVLGLYSILAHE